MSVNQRENRQIIDFNHISFGRKKISYANKEVWRVMDRQDNKLLLTEELLLSVSQGTIMRYTQIYV